jgi:hypothetical protein
MHYIKRNKNIIIIFVCSNNHIKSLKMANRAIILYLFLPRSLFDFDR